MIKKNFGKNVKVNLRVKILYIIYILYKWI